MTIRKPVLHGLSHWLTRLKQCTARSRVFFLRESLFSVSNKIVLTEKLKAWSWSGISAMATVSTRLGDDQLPQDGSWRDRRTYPKRNADDKRAGLNKSAGPERIPSLLSEWSQTPFIQPESASNNAAGERVRLKLFCKGNKDDTLILLSSSSIFKTSWEFFYRRQA